MGSQVQGSPFRVNFRSPRAMVCIDEPVNGHGILNTAAPWILPCLRRTKA